LVMIWISRRLSSVLSLEDFRYLLMACRQLGSRPQMYLTNTVPSTY
jgi:hypothetical protein